MVSKRTDSGPLGLEAFFGRVPLGSLLVSLDLDGREISGWLVGGLVKNIDPGRRDSAGIRDSVLL